ncbi:transposase [Sphingobium sp. AM]|uniref:transposase n=1 Tax=Sphingobium sp. AM TaxID=1176302 RepID=UPI000A47EEDE|nr:transposase [Sphingobium sp. AM]
MSQMTVISGPERRRVWTDQQKRELVAAVSAPGANVAEIARRADLRPNQIYRWRRQMEQAAQGFAEVQVQADPVPMIGSAITGGVMRRVGLCGVLGGQARAAHEPGGYHSA